MNEIRIPQELYIAVGEYIAENLMEKPARAKGGRVKSAARREMPNMFILHSPLMDYCECAAEPDIDKLIREKDESFSEALLRLIDERKISDADCYKAAGVDRKLFSKIRSDKDYHPSKPTVFAFAIALSLDMTEAEHLLRCAGFAFSESSTFDIIVRYFIERGLYDINLVNDTLYSYDQKLLGV